jgi:hypothetical protein
MNANETTHATHLETTESYDRCTDCDVCGEISMCRLEAGGLVCWECDRDDERARDFVQPKQRNWTFIAANGVEVKDMSDIEIDEMLDREIEDDDDLDYMGNPYRR